MSRPTLILQPVHNSSAEILRHFVEGKPLNSDQRNFLEWHQREISNTTFDPVLRYYLQHHNAQQYQGTFLLPHEALNFEGLQQFKKRLLASLRQNNRIAVPMTQQQFMQFKAAGIHELIFWHGNQLLTGMPFYPGGIPPVIYFQWGNAFGIVKYVVLSGEKALKANLLVYFEDMEERHLEQCVKDYQLQLQKETELQNHLILEHRLPQEPLNQFLIKGPHP